MLALLAVLFAAGALGFVYFEVSRQASRDEARPADAIVVLGAAQYNGKPSPVLKARLDHALELYERKLASRIIATGGHGLGAKFSEGEVSRQYLSEHGVPAEFITVETTGQSTMQSVAAVGEIMDRMRLRSCIVVSDDYHMHRAKKMLEDAGLLVYGSPRDATPGDEWTRRKRFLRESLSYLMWRIGIRV
ncbi:MAG: YdcF family protein [Acidobacteria bacterium]|nr:YdcF family protein [Acidobacteriota bacterium]